MAKMMKKITALILAVMLCLGQTVFPVTALSTQTTTTGTVAGDPPALVEGKAGSITTEQTIVNDTTYIVNQPAVGVDSEGNPVNGVVNGSVSGGSSSTTASTMSDAAANKKEQTLQDASAYDAGTPAVTPSGDPVLDPENPEAWNETDLGSTTTVNGQETSDTSAFDALDESSVPGMDLTGSTPMGPGSSTTDPVQTTFETMDREEDNEETENMDEEGKTELGFEPAYTSTTEQTGTKEVVIPNGEEYTEDEYQLISRTPRQEDIMEERLVELEEPIIVYGDNVLKPDSDVTVLDGETNYPGATEKNSFIKPNGTEPFANHDITVIYKEGDNYYSFVFEGSNGNGNWMCKGDKFPDHDTAPSEWMELTVIDNVTGLRYAAKLPGKNLGNVHGKGSEHLVFSGIVEPTIITHEKKMVKTGERTVYDEVWDWVPVTKYRDKVEYVPVYTTTWTATEETDGYEVEITAKDVLPEEFYNEDGTLKEEYTLEEKVIDGKKTWIVTQTFTVDPSRTEAVEGSESYKEENYSVDKVVANDAYFNMPVGLQSVISEDGSTKTTTWTDADGNTYVKTETKGGLVDDLGQPIYKTDANGKLVLDAEGNYIQEQDFINPVYTKTSSITTTGSQETTGELTDEQIQEFLKQAGAEGAQAEADGSYKLVVPGTPVYTPPALPTGAEDPDMDGIFTLTDASGVVTTYTPAYEGSNLYYKVSKTYKDAAGNDVVENNDLHGYTTTVTTYTVVDSITKKITTYKKTTVETVETTEFRQNIQTTTKDWTKQEDTITTESIVHTYQADSAEPKFEFNGTMYSVTDGNTANDVQMNAIKNAGITVTGKGQTEGTYSSAITIKISQSWTDRDTKKATVIDANGNKLGTFILGECKTGLAKAAKLLTGSEEAEVVGDDTYVLSGLELPNGARFTISLAEPELGEFTVNNVDGAANVAAVNGAELAFDMSFTVNAPSVTYTKTTNTNTTRSDYSAHQQKQTISNTMAVKSVTTTYEDTRDKIIITGEITTYNKTVEETKAAWEKIVTLFTADEGEKKGGEEGGNENPPEPPVPPVPPVGGGVPMMLALDIDDEPVPLVHEPEEAIEILDEEVPLADAPSTGDASILWGIMGMMSLGGSSLLNKGSKKVRKGGKYLKK